MKRETTTIELGRASVATKGAVGPGFDIRNQLEAAGLAQD